ALEGVEVLALDLKRCGRWSGAAATESAKPAKRRALRAHAVRHARVGRLRLRAALPPAVQHRANQNDQPDLEQQTDERREASEPTQEAVAEQHAEEAGAEQTAQQSPGEAAPEAAAEQSTRLLHRR